MEAIQSKDETSLKDMNNILKGKFMLIASDTQVDRDDLADQGAAHVAATVRQLKQRPV